MTISTHSLINTQVRKILHKRLPHNKSDIVDAGHFAWADAADEYANLIIDWWNGGYERV